VRYIDEHVGERHEDADGQGLRWGVESICAGLTELGVKIAPETYYEHRGRKPTAREQRDEDLKPRSLRHMRRTTASTALGRSG
jgi:putative transposase